MYDDDLRVRLIDAAAGVMAADGPGAISLRALAAGAGTSTTAIYSLFGGKDELVAAVLEAGQEGLTEAQLAVPDTGDLAADLLERALAYRRWAMAHPALYQVMYGARGLPYAVTPGDTHGAIRPLINSVERAMAAGLLRSDDPVEVAVALWSAAHGLVSLEIAGLLPPEEGEARFGRQLIAAAHFWLAS